MRRYSEAVKADVRRRMTPPHRQSVAQISAELGIHVVTLYNWRKTWRIQGEMVPASEKDPEGWGSTDKFTVVLETAGLNTTELSAYCRERGLYPEQVQRWRMLLTSNEPEFAAVPPGQIVAFAIPAEKTASTGQSSASTACCTPLGGRTEAGVELGYHLTAHHRARCVALPVSGARRLEPQSGGRLLALFLFEPVFYQQKNRHMPGL
jgi:hypothetical protein